MGLTIALVDERGEMQAEPITDPRDMLGQLLPAGDGSEYQWLPYIDRYGDTIFNHLQVEPFLREWRSLYGKARTEPERTLLAAVEQLAKSCEDGVHLYLKFIGD